MCVEHTSPESEQGLPSVQRCPGAVAWVLSGPRQASFQLPVCSAEPRWLLGDHDVTMLPLPISIRILATGGKSHCCSCQQPRSLSHICLRFSPGLNRCLGSVAVVRTPRPYCRAHGFNPRSCLGKILYAVLCGKKNQTKQKSKIIPDFANVPRIPPVPSEDGLQVSLMPSGP